MKFLFAAILVGFLCGFAHAHEINLVQNPGFEEVDPTAHLPSNYELKDAAFWGYLGTYLDFATNGIIFPGDAPNGSSVSQMVRGIDQSKGRWLSFRFRGLAEDGFSNPDGSLKMKMEFFSKNGTNYLDCASRPIYGEIQLDRQNLTVNGDFHHGGAAVWRSYELEELLPFPEVDSVRISVACDNSVATGSQHATFLIDDFSLVQRMHSLTGKVDPADRIPSTKTTSPLNTSKLQSLGGRWYYEPLPGENVSPSSLTVTEDNADRLFYKSDKLINPFLNNMTAWLRAGYKDEQGNIVAKDQFVPDNVVLRFKGDGFLTVTSRNIPNHPTAKFPGYNPNYIQEMTQTFRLPLEPVLNPDAVAVDEHNTNHALPMGPIGIMVNGVVFFNQFDAQMTDASNIMDYCCGHPNPDGQYHYHKYPICVNTPFVDKGDAPSQVIGFAFDGLPVYGPYQDAGVMAKDSTTNPLNAFNACYDDVRGWHYHVTPGKFPYIIGGYFAKVEASNIQHMGPRGGAPGMAGRQQDFGPPGDFGAQPPPPTE
jgi:hypothetical protein